MSSPDHKYTFVDGHLLKVDLQGNVLETITLNVPRASKQPQTEEMDVENLLDDELVFSAVGETGNRGEPQGNGGHIGADFPAPPTHDPTTYSPPPRNSPERSPSPSAITSSDDIQAIADKSRQQADLAALEKRDKEAVSYSRNLLNEGDTLVYILYPGKAYDSTGFCVSDAVHRVHSEKLLATGSARFKDLLSPTKQFRTIRKKHINLANKLPPGIKYVLDLTPPDEGDEAVDLTASLSCSTGITQWYSAEHRIGVSTNLCGGRDEYVANATHHRAGSYGGYMTPEQIQYRHDLMEEQKMNIGEKANTVVVGPDGVEYSQPVGFNSQDQDQAALPPVPPSSHAQADRELAEAIRASIPPKPTLPMARKPWKYRESAEYDPIRHRTGITRLLQAIEGKDPRLDSAPKVWTLLGLAQYFDCTSVVIDWIVMWMIADPNVKFIELLPEASCKIGFGLQSALIARSAFAILVGEEALSLVARSHGKYLADQRGTNQFGRRTESVDEDLKTRIEYASKAFVDRISEKFKQLMWPDCSWFDESREFRKLNHFYDHLKYLKDTGPSVAGYSNDVRNKLFEGWMETIDQLKLMLRHWIRGLMVRTLTESLSDEQTLAANKTRLAEDYGPQPNPTKMDVIYDNLAPDERVMTTFFWWSLKNIQAGYGYPKSNVGFGRSTEEQDQNKILAKAFQVEEHLFTELRNDQLEANLAILAAIKTGFWNDGNIPDCCYVHVWSGKPAKDHANIKRAVRDVFRQPAFNAYGNPQTILPIRSQQDPDLDQPAQSINSADQGTNKRQKTDDKDVCGPNEVRWTKDLVASPKSTSSTTLDGKTTSRTSPEQFDRSDYSTTFPSQVVDDDDDEVSSFPSQGKQRKVPAGNQPYTRGPVIPMDQDLDEDAIFFNLDRFMCEAQRHIDKVADSALSKQDINIDIDLTDTLVSLGVEEFKYLPLWAGGDDDGSGGVFNDDIPTAVGGPVGPGPAFHTGFSIPSQGSEKSWDTDTISQMTSRNTSELVEDGFSDALPRSRVVSDDGWRSETFSEGNLGEWDGIGKGKAPAYQSSIATVETKTEGGIYSDYAPSDTGTETGYDFVDVGNDSQEETMETSGTGKGKEKEVEIEVDDNDMFDDDEEEAFDFGDGNEIDDGEDDEDMNMT